VGVRVGIDPVQNRVEPVGKELSPTMTSELLTEGSKVGLIEMRRRGLSPTAAVFFPAMARLQRMIREESVLTKRRQVSRFVSQHLRNGSFSVRGLQKAVAKEFNIRQGLVINKPDGMEVRSMFDINMFRSGTSPVPSNLDRDRMMALHCESCDRCREHYKKYLECSKDCYYSAMDKCVTNGWNPVIQRDSIRPRYRVANSKNCTLYPNKVAEEVKGMEDHEVLVRLWSFEEGKHLINALGAIVKTGDILRAKVLTGIIVVDEESLLAASRELVRRGFPKIKVRITIDCSGSGLNGAAYSPSFTMPGFHEALRRVFPGCFMSKGDVARYFHSFPISKEFRNFLVVEFADGIYYNYQMVPMGFTASPYYASTWSAEFRQWMLARGLDPAFLMDDWFLTGTTEEEARSRMRRLYELMQEAGFTMAEDKFEVAQIMVFLGILIDSTTMTCRIEKSQASGFKQQLLLYIERLSAAGGNLDLASVRHVAGKLSWFSEVIQSGRLHINEWWQYAGLLEGWHQHRNVSALISETRWWVDVLESWELDIDCHQACRIFNAGQILARPACLQLVQSDASGTDGLGYVCSAFGSSEYKYYSKTWVTRPRQSHQAELLALLEYFRRDLVRDTLIMWITDSQSAAWSINKGNCHDPVGRPVLAEILGLCDELQCQIFAIWIPREENELPDLLSHLSCLMSRDEVEGWSGGEAL
jgi:hypothetical protein